MFSSWNRFFQRFFYFFFLWGTTVSFAHQFSIVPTQLSLTTKDPIGVLNVKNLDSKTVILQLSLKEWSQHLNKDSFRETTDLIVTPPLFKLPPGKTQLIRVAALTHADSSKEKAYRLFLEEVIPAPEAMSSLKKDELTVALRISLPVFMEPLQPPQQRLTWNIKQGLKNDFTVTAVNVGTKVVFINQLQAFNQKTQPITPLISTFAYILPGESYGWNLLKNHQGIPFSIGATVNRAYVIENVASVH